jgi:hypothetical protein
MLEPLLLIHYKRFVFAKINIQLTYCLNSELRKIIFVDLHEKRFFASKVGWYQMSVVVIKNICLVTTESLVTRAL